MDRKQSTIRVQCTCCEAVLTVDKVSGEVVFTEKPKTKKISFEDAFQKVKQDQETADERFKEAFMKEKDRMKVIDKKFEEAMKRKDELETPIKPIDLD
jgi:fatty acid-binding protein DegV